MAPYPIRKAREVAKMINELAQELLENYRAVSVFSPTHKEWSKCEWENLSPEDKSFWIAYARLLERSLEVEYESDDEEGAGGGDSE